MTDADLDLRLRHWLTADAASAAPPSLRARVLDIPAAPARTTGWWHRFASAPIVTGAVAAVTVAAMVLSGTVFTLFDRAPGTDGGLCNNRQLQQALDELRDTDGYRYVDTQQQQVLLSDPAVSLENPEFGWADTLTSRVAYLAPDRTHEVVTSIEPGADRGFLEQVRIGNEQWQLREIDGDATWVRDTPWPFGNWAWGYVQNVMGILGTPGIASIRFGSEPVPADVPGEGGCTIAASGEVETRIVALRIAEDDRVSGIYLGPPAGAPGNRDASRNLIELDYTLPGEDEFVAPPEFTDAGELYPEVSMPPQPTVGPLDAPEAGWEPIAFPLPGGDVVGGAVGGFLEVDGRWTAVGSAQVRDYAFQALAWTSTDGVSWDLVPSPPGFTGVALSEIVWDGETFLAVGYRPQQQRDDGTADADRPESWLSTDGLNWEPGGMFEAGANPGRPIATDVGWVAAGSIWSGMEQRPAFFSSPDGATWTTHRPVGTAYGMMSAPTVDADGTIRATSCETPERTNTAGGSPCFEREWTSTDGETWSAGPVREATGDDLLMVPAGDGFLAVGSDPVTTEPQLLRSTDGTTWEPTPLPAASMYPSQVLEIPGGIILFGQASDTSATVSFAWRSTDGGSTWEEIPLGVLPGAVGSWTDRVIVTDRGMAILGSMYLDELSAVPVVWVEP